METGVWNVEYVRISDRVHNEATICSLTCCRNEEQCAGYLDMSAATIEVTGPTSDDGGGSGSGSGSGSGAWILEGQSCDSMWVDCATGCQSSGDYCGVPSTGVVCGMEQCSEDRRMPEPLTCPAGMEVHVDVSGDVGEKWNSDGDYDIAGTYDLLSTDGYIVDTIEFAPMAEGYGSGNNYVGVTTTESGAAPFHFSVIGKTVSTHDPDGNHIYVTLTPDGNLKSDQGMFILKKGLKVSLPTALTSPGSIRVPCPPGKKGSVVLLCTDGVLRVAAETCEPMPRGVCEAVSKVCGDPEDCVDTLPESRCAAVVRRGRCDMSQFATACCATCRSDSLAD
jgi:hypothetical protein